PVIAALDNCPDETPLRSVIGGRRRAQLAALAAAGVQQVGDARTLCLRTASYSDAPMQDLPEQIDQARPALRGRPAYRRRGVAAVLAERGDVEVDIDMENTQEGVYLWGALVTIRAAWNGHPVGYRAFCTWQAMCAAAEAREFTRFWTWLSSLRQSVA